MPLIALLFVASTLLLAGTSAAQTAPMQDDLVAWVSGRVAQVPGPDSDLYIVPTAAELAAFGAAVDALADEKISDAQLAARSAGYGVDAFVDTDTGQTFHALLPLSGSGGGRGFFFVRAAAESASDVVFAAPQPVSSAGSAETAARHFLDLEARGLALAGAHRCASAQYSGCGGQTTACSSAPEGFRASDVAHAPSSYFQVFQERLVLASPETAALRIVGMESPARDGAVFRLADGTTADLPGAGILATFHDHLEEGFSAIDPSFHGTSCGLAGDPDLDCAEDDSLGRTLNGGLACGTGTVQPSGRFTSLALSDGLLSGGTLGGTGGGTGGLAWDWVKKVWLPPVSCSAPDATNVEIDVLELVPASSPTSTELRQYAWVSPSLLQALGLGGENFNGDHSRKPQVRVTMTDPDNGLSAPFIVVGTFAHPGLAIRIQSLDGSASGLSKLFDVDDLADVPNLAQARASVWNGAASMTQHLGPVVTYAQHFCEPENGFGRLRDRRSFEANAEVLLLIPHGGNIESGTSELIYPTRQTLLGRGFTTNYWEAIGEWDGNGSTHAQWHVTSTAIREDAFPGLAAVQDGDDQTADYDYTLAFHGYSNNNHRGMVMGGKAETNAKCFLVDAVRQELANANQDPNLVEHRIYTTDDTCIQLPGFALAASSTSHLKGTASANVVNRYTDVDPQLPGSGGVQVEMSTMLRNDTDTARLVAQGLANGLATLISQPGTDLSNACNAFVACQ